MFEAETSLTEKAEQERERLQNVYAPMLRVLNCVLLTGEVKIKVADVVVSTNHMTFLSNRFLRLISLPTSTIFVLEQVVSRPF